MYLVPTRVQDHQEADKQARYTEAHCIYHTTPYDTFSNLPQVTMALKVAIYPASGNCLISKTRHKCTRYPSPLLHIIPTTSSSDDDTATPTIHPAPGSNCLDMLIVSMGHSYVTLDIVGQKL